MRSDKDLIEALERSAFNHGAMPLPNPSDLMRQAAARLRALTAEPEVKQVTWRRGDVAVAKMSTQDGLTEGKEYVVLAVNGEGDTVQIMDNDGRTNFRMAHYFTRLTAEPDEASGLVEFAKEMCRVGFDGGSLDGCDILDTAVKHGLCRITQYHADMTGIANAEYFEEGDVVYVFDGPLLTAAPQEDGK